MRAEGCVVEEAYLDLLHQVFCRRRPQQTQPERVLQRPPQPLDQRDGALLPDRPKPLLHSEPKELPAKDPAREAASAIRYEMRRPSVLPRRPRHEASDLSRRRLLRE